MTNNYFFPRGGFDEITCGFSFPVLIVNTDNCHASETRQEKEPQEVNDQQKRNASIYCLCPRCRAMFFNTQKFSISRVDPYQFDKDDCTFCQTGTGYDYQVVPRLPRSKSNGGHYGR